MTGGRVVVTGAAGFVGSHLCEALLAEGWDVTGIDSFDDFYERRIKTENIAAAARSSAFSLEEADIRDADAMGRILPGADMLVHLAARAGVRPSIENPLLYQDVNVRGTQILLETLRAHGIRKMVFASSSSVYGNNKTVPFSETDNVDFPISPYAATKKAAELLCHAYHHLFELDISCLRLFTVYGPRQRPDLAIHKFARKMLAGESIPVFGDGSTRRDYTYVGDIVSGIRAAMAHCEGYRIYNLGNSSPVSLTDLISGLESAVGRPAQIERLPDQPGDVQMTYANIERARSELGYAPQTPLKEGLEAFVAWLRQGPSETP